VELPLQSVDTKENRSEELGTKDHNISRTDKDGSGDDADFHTASDDDKLERDNTLEDSDRTEEDEQSPSLNLRRGPGRPKIIRTGQRGRPKKEYQVANIAEIETDPLTVEDAMSNIHKDKWLEAMQDDIVHYKNVERGNLPNSLQVRGQ